MGEAKRKMGMVKVSEIILPTKPRHKRLRKDQQERVQFVWQAMGPRCAAPSYKQLDYNMRCDVHPDREITICVAIARAFLEFRQQRPDTDLDALAKALWRLSLKQPIFHVDAETIEALAVRHLEAAFQEFRTQFGEQAAALLGEDVPDHD